MPDQKKDRQSKKLRSVKSERRSEFLPPRLAKLRPLHPDSRALEAVRRAFDRLRSEYPLLVSFGEKNTTTLRVKNNHQNLAYRELLDITHSYWFGRRVYERKPREDFITELEKIRKATAELSEVLVNTPRAVLGLLRPALQRQFSGNPIWPGLSEKSSTLSEEKKVALVLHGLTVACEEIPLPKDQRGAREKKHITEAASALVSFWSTSGHDFKKSFRTAPGRDGLHEFISDGPQFVWRILSAIDPTLPIGEVRSALQSVGVKKLSRK